MNRIATLSVVTASLLACIPIGPDDPACDDAGNCIELPELSITEVGDSCKSDGDPNTADGEWDVFVKTAAWAEGGAELHITHTAMNNGAVEKHDLRQGPYADDGTADEWHDVLIVVEPGPQLQPSQTGFPCELQEELSWQVIAFDISGYPADCVVWGHDVPGLLELEPACRDIP